MSDSTGESHYALGHTERELERLSTQARLIDPITRQYLVEAGVGPGMRVLDVGSGAGDVAFLAASLVGETGEVVGADRSAVALATAKARAERLGLSNVSFREGDPAEMKFERPFDAVIGRYVLEFQPEPVVMLRKVAAHARTGGLVVFHEIDLGGGMSFPPVPTYDRCLRWLIETFRRMGGVEPRMGAVLHSAFIAAGLPAPTMRLQAVIGGAVNSLDVLHFLADVIVTMLPEIERHGVATADEVGLDTLVERIRDEALATGSVVVRSTEIGAWARV